MYKNFLILFLVFLVSGTMFVSCSSDDDGGTNPDPDPAINLIFPNGGDSLELGVSYKITWTDDIDENIDIEFYEEITGNAVKIFQFLNVPSNGEYQFIVPFDLNLASDYMVKLVSVIDPTINDESETYFGVIDYVDDGDNLPVDAIEVTIPHLEDYAIYSSGDIDWYKVYLYAGQKYFFSNSSEDDFDSEFYIYEGNSEGTDVIGVVSTDDNSGPGSQPYIEFSATEEGYYFLRVAHSSNDPAKQLDTGYYTLSITEDILLTAPNGGEVWMYGSSHEITWGTDITGNVILSLENESETVMQIATVNGVDSTYTWIIPNSVDPGVNYKVRVANENNSASIDESDDYFAISNSDSVNVVDSWNVHGTWGKWDRTWEFLDDGTWTNNEGTSGTWELTGNGIRWDYTLSDTYYIGIVVDDTMSGIMNGGSGLVGTWNAVRILD